MSSQLPLERRLRILGATFETYFIFSPHINSIISRVSYRINIAKDVAGINWSQQKENILLTYKSLLQIKISLIFDTFLSMPVSFDTQSLIINNPETSDTPEFSPLRSHQLRYDGFH